MSWAKKNAKKAVLPETAENNTGISQYENMLTSAEAENGRITKDDKMSKEDIWEYIKMRIISYAPVMIPLVYLPVVQAKEKAGILCNGKEIYISDEFWQLPLDDFMYMTVREFTQVLLGFRVNKNIEVSDTVPNKSIVITEAEMMFAKVQNMLCDTFLLSCPGAAGIDASLIKPSEELLNCIHESFGVYTSSKNQYVNYIDNPASLKSFKDKWSNKSLNSVYDQLSSGYDLCRNKSDGPYTDIKFSIFPYNLNRFVYMPGETVDITDISNIPNGNFLINIPPELTKQTLKQLQDSSLQEPTQGLKGGENASENSSGGESNASGGNKNTNEPENSQNKNEDVQQSKNNENGSNSGSSRNNPEGRNNGKQSSSEGMHNKNKGSFGNNAYNENEGSFGSNAHNENEGGSGNDANNKDKSGSENGHEKNSEYYASEFSSVLNKKQAGMDTEVYKEILSKAKRYLDDSPIGYDKNSFGSRITKIYNKLYKVSSVWWKKAQSMIMSYVPDVNSSYRRPNKKFAMTEFVLPSQCEKAQSFEVDRLRVFLDSSGSMTSEDFKIFKSLIKSAQKFFPQDTLAYEFNTAVTPMKCVRGKIIGSPAHTGGTDIGCVTKFISAKPDKGKALNIVVTDGGFNWNELVSYMKKEDRLSKFLFIITTANRYYSEAVKEINAKRLKVLLINDYGRF